MMPTASVFPQWLSIFAAALAGACAGSFFNVVLLRVPEGKSVIWPPSHCPSCLHRLSPLENVPIISWLWLRGRCRWCRAAISLQYPVVELVCALLGATIVAAWSAGFVHRPTDFWLAFWYLALALVPITWMDLRHYLIPDVLNYLGIALGFALSLLPGGSLTVVESLAGCAGGFGILWGVRWLGGMLLKKEAMGWGDIKLLAMGGSLFGIQAVVMGLFLASLLGAAVSLPILLLKRDRNVPIPFGPFLGAGILLAAAVGEPIWHLYLGLWVP